MDYLVHMLDLPYSTPWGVGSPAFLAVAVACWPPGVVIEIRMRNMMAARRLPCRLERTHDER